MAEPASASGGPSNTSPGHPGQRIHVLPYLDRRIRLVYCIDNLGVGGTELNAVRTLERLDRSAFQVSVVCLRADGALFARLYAAGIPVLRLPLRSLYGPSAARQAMRLTRFLRHEGVQIVHSHDIYTNVLATFCARVARVPLIIASRRWWHSLPRRGHRVANAVAYQVAHCVLANSPAVAESLRHEQRVPAKRILTIPNFVDEEAFAPLDETERWRQLDTIGVPAGALVAGVVARLTPVKDHASLFAALAQIATRHPALHLVLIGDGESRADLERQVVALGLAGRVHFAGQRPNTSNLHRLLDISILCSTSEGFPNSVVEAMAAGKPVIGTRVGGVPDAIEDEVTGLLVPPSDVAALADAIDRLAGDSSLRESIGHAGQRHARREFHVATVVPRLEAAYRERLGKRVGRRARTVASGAPPDTVPGR